MGRMASLGETVPSLSSGNTGASFYDFAIIRRSNTVLENIDNVEFTTAGKKKKN